MSAPRQSIDVFWSFRSPYCYFSLDRLITIKATFEVDVIIRPVYPMAVRNPNFFKEINPKYRKYHLLDCERVAEFHQIPYRRPVPDPIVQNLETSAIAAEQPYIRKLTRLGAAAQEAGASLAFVDKVARILWDGSTDNWHQGDHLRSALSDAGLPADKVLANVEADPDHFDDIIAENQTAHGACDHWGVPAIVFAGETFYGQDRLDLLAWRLDQIDGGRKAN